MESKKKDFFDHVATVMNWCTDAFVEMVTAPLEMGPLARIGMVAVLFGAFRLCGYAASHTANRQKDYTRLTSSELEAVMKQGREYSLLGDVMGELRTLFKQRDQTLPKPLHVGVADDSLFWGPR